MITFSKVSFITTLRGDDMNSTNKSTISELVKPFSTIEMFKQNRDVLSIFGTSAVKAEPKQEGKPCPAAR